MSRIAGEEPQLIKAREGDFIETEAGIVFDVKGLVHPPNRVIAFPRYFPDNAGGRKKNGTAYQKVYSLAERCDFLKQRYPQYLIHDSVFDEILCEVPTRDIKRLYKPAQRLQQLRRKAKRGGLETNALKLAELVKEESKIRWNTIGVSGSLLVKLHDTSSDVDLVVYGSDNCRRVHSALAKMLKEHSAFRPYRKRELKTLFDFRSKDTKMTYEDFVRTESKKVMQGMFLGTEYFFRFVKEWSEVKEKYGDTVCRNLGTAEIEGDIIDDSQSVFTPCSYGIDCNKVIEGNKTWQLYQIMSFRGRFCDQAKNGDRIVARGKVERVTDVKQRTEHLRLMIGNCPSDFMILK